MTSAMSLEDTMSLGKEQGADGTVFMIPSTQSELCLFFTRLRAHDLITRRARRQPRGAHLN